MSYDIQIFRTETKERDQKLNDGSFFDHEENLEPFTNEQHHDLKEKLIAYDYILKQESGAGLIFKHSEFDIEALLTKRGLYFTASWNEESIFEAGMTASELADDIYQKYDPQNGGWEEI